MKIIVHSLLPILILCSHPVLSDPSEDGLGRLFTTPQERLIIPKQKKSAKPAMRVAMQARKIAVKERSSLRAPITSMPTVINLQGYVKRYDNEKSTLWINGRASLEGEDTPSGKIGQLKPSEQNNNWVLEMQTGTNTLKLYPQPPKITSSQRTKVPKDATS